MPYTKASLTYMPYTKASLIYMPHTKASLTYMPHTKASLISHCSSRVIKFSTCLCWQQHLCIIMAFLLLPTIV